MYSWLIRVSFNYFFSFLVVLGSIIFQVEDRKKYLESEIRRNLTGKDCIFW